MLSDSLAMRILALETSGRGGSLALSEGDRSTNFIESRLFVDLPSEQRTAQCLAPAMKRAFAEVEWRPDTVELIAVAQGPGSFTGLRIGVTTAKALAYATGAKLVGVSTLAVLAYQSQMSAGRVWSLLDAQRGELFAQRYNASTKIALAADETRIVAVEEWLKELHEGDAVTGPMLVKLRDRLPAGVVTVDDSLWEPQATAVGELGWHRFLHCLTEDVWQFVPHYHRRSAAEEKANRTG